MFGTDFRVVSIIDSMSDNEDMGEDPADEVNDNE
jgi:hypothetical protein